MPGSPALTALLLLALASGAAAQVVLAIASTQACLCHTQCRCPAALG